MEFKTGVFNVDQICPDIKNARPTGKLHNLKDPDLYIDWILLSNLPLSAFVKCFIPRPHQYYHDFLITIKENFPKQIHISLKIIEKLIRNQSLTYAHFFYYHDDRVLVILLNIAFHDIVRHTVSAICYFFNKRGRYTLGIF